ncbi:unnamed protein product [Spirodela intermedia]|uniref:O-acyltransferase WSD1 C-terminal domain-containing protein n=1 Tax=Spirodela intermedia TaxID=51605 RepID=A0A7I8IYV5_SPIIN|nr:unnamed protein product [Spirodela intermedia]CAA6663176.1 unnamed protein product [Spirodela intermedia]
MGRGEEAAELVPLYDEPASPLGRVTMLPLLEQVIHWVFSFQNPVDIDAVKAVLQSSLIKNCPRLRSPTYGEGDYGEDRENDIYINEYVAALASSPPMRREIPLWEMHVLPRRGGGGASCYDSTMRLGTVSPSWRSSSPAARERAGEPGIPITFSEAGGEGKRRAEFSLKGMWRTVKKAWNTLLYSVESSIQLVSPVDKTAIAGVRLLPRKLATLALCLDDIKTVKNKLNATINDVFVGIISCGIERYHKLKFSNDYVIRGNVAVSTRGEGSKKKKVAWGNKVSYFPLALHRRRRSRDPLSYVRKAIATLSRKKLSLQPQFSYKRCALILNLFGPKAIDFLSHQLYSNTDLILSNIVDPLDVVTFAKNHITKIGVTPTSPPLALEIHMLTYNGKAFLNVLVAADIIPDPELLCKSRVMDAEDYGSESINSQLTPIWMRMLPPAFQHLNKTRRNEQPKCREGNDPDFSIDLSAQICIESYQSAFHY